MSAHLATLKKAAGPLVQISGEEAAKSIVASGSSEEVAFDATEAARLGLKVSDIVAIAPVDTGMQRFYTSQPVYMLISWFYREGLSYSRKTSGSNYGGVCSRDAGLLWCRPMSFTEN